MNNRAFRRQHLKQVSQSLQKGMTPELRALAIDELRTSSYELARDILEEEMSGILGIGTSEQYNEIDTLLNAAEEEAISIADDLGIEVDDLFPVEEPIDEELYVEPTPPPAFNPELPDPAGNYDLSNQEVIYNGFVPQSELFTMNQVGVATGLDSQMPNYNCIHRDANDCGWLHFTVGGRDIYFASKPIYKYSLSRNMMEAAGIISGLGPNNKTLTKDGETFVIRTHRNGVGPNGSPMKGGEWSTLMELANAANVPGGLHLFINSVGQYSIAQELRYMQSPVWGDAAVTSTRNLSKPDIGFNESHWLKLNNNAYGNHIGWRPVLQRITNNKGEGGVTKSPEVIEAETNGIGPFRFNGFDYYVAPASLRTKHPFGPPNSSAPVGMWNDGAQLTERQAAIPAEYPAAAYIKTLGSGWFLPSSVEGNAVVVANSAAIDAADPTEGVRLAQMSSVSRSQMQALTSTQYNYSYVTTMNFSANSTPRLYKAETGWVIAVRKVPVAD